MTLNNLIKRLEEIRATHGGKLPINAEWTEHGETSLAWQHIESFIVVKEPDTEWDCKRLVIG